MSYANSVDVDLGLHCLRMFHGLDGFIKHLSYKAKICYPKVAFQHKLTCFKQIYIYSNQILVFSLSVCVCVRACVHVCV